MEKLSLIKSEQFGTVQADIYSNGKDMFMTINQLADCLDYASKSGVENIISRNEYLKSVEFSSTHKLWVDGKQRETRIFTEDGIYEVTMLSSQAKAKEFRAWIRAILKSLRSGKAKLVSMTDYQRLSMETRQENIKIRKAGLLTRIADQCNVPEYKQVLHSKVTEILTGQALLPLPEADQKTYSASDIGEMFGVSRQTIGRLANANGLKTEEFGKVFYDKASHCDKQVESFRYYESVIPEFRRLLGE